MRAFYILSAAATASLSILITGCGGEGFGSNGGVTSVTSAKVADPEPGILHAVRDRDGERSSGPDAALYFASLDAERASSLEKAKAGYEQLVSQYSSSGYVPYALFALAELHRDSLESEQDQHANALEQYRAILKMRGLDDELHALVLVRAAECQDYLGDKDAASWARSEVWKHYRTTRAAELVPHEY